MTTFKVGDTVKSRSGGLVMTVTVAQYDDDTYCMWFDRDGKRQEMSFKAGALKSAAAPDE